FEGWALQRTLFAVKLDIAARRRRRVVPGITALDRPHGVGGALDRALGNIGGMRIADCFILDRAQAEALRRIVGRLFEPAIVEGRKHRGSLVRTSESIRALARASLLVPPLNPKFALEAPKACANFGFAALGGS